MKKEWIKPLVEVQDFVANDYVAACYSGTCNISGEVYMDTNGNGQFDENIDAYKYKNTACDHTFEVTGQDSPKPQANAFVVDKEWIPGHWVGSWNGHWEKGYWKTEATPVYNFDNVHVATMDSIHTHERPNHS